MAQKVCSLLPKFSRHMKFIPVNSNPIIFWIRIFLMYRLTRFTSTNRASSNWAILIWAEHCQKTIKAQVRERSYKHHITTVNIFCVGSTPEPFAILTQLNLLSVFNYQLNQHCSKTGKEMDPDFEAHKEALVKECQEQMEKIIVWRYDPYAPYDAYNEADGTEENAKSGYLKGVRW